MICCWVGGDVKIMGKYTLRHIKEIGKLAVELRKDLSGQPLKIRRKISSIANLSGVVESDISFSQIIEKIYVCPYCNLEYTKPEGAKTCCVNRSKF